MKTSSMSNSTQDADNGLSTERRRFLKRSSLLLGGLAISTWLPPMTRNSFASEAISGAQLGDNSVQKGGYGAFVRVGTDGKVTLISSKIEMGQGVQTGMAMMVAEELEVQLKDVSVVEAPANAALYTDPLLQFQATGGSTSTRATWEPLRKAGATARMLLIQAAANRWNVDATLCTAKAGTISGPEGQTVNYADVVEDAIELPIPTEVTLKSPESFTLIGTPAQRLDTPAKVNGSAKFTIDLSVPNMLIASTITCPVLGGKVKQVDASKARAIKGVKDVITLPNAVAVTANNTWTCFKAIKALDIEWDLGDNASVNSEEEANAVREASRQQGAVAKTVGEIDTALKEAPHTFEASYEQPFLSHSPLEPMTCVAHVRQDSCDLWVGTQVPDFAQKAAAKLTGLAPENIAVHNQLIGGAFGRRLEYDFIIQAVQIAQHVNYPIKLTWSREEDMTHDLYRPHYVDHIQAALDDNLEPTGWRQHIAGASVLASYVGSLPDSGVDGDAVEVAIDPIYALSDLEVQYNRQDAKSVNISWWRGVGPLRSTFVQESFIDELAHHANVDPLTFRYDRLKEHPRAQALLKVVEEASDWHSALPEGHGRGVSISHVFGGYVATVIELAMQGELGVKIKRVISAVDCGIVTNPTSVSAQIEGGTLFGISAAFFNEIHIENGAVQQKNYDTYRQLRITDAPSVEVHITKSAEQPGGVGEAGTSLAAPALVNALYAASGKRIRRIPLNRHGYFTV
ncbi:xanthine dehydrogenase family protein molybdopterin-binding subunit [Neptunomonas phycophila]|uniref:xanthine dehydrogenase family protein molybdopterin-binding subunit n=1 Tax=Neptunomonas phycophila TaxID=1572645 RepID=UPI0009F8B835|nr:molybdopterin cofactor-binding domain-containing protein [Neptunomonas phycophila]